MILFSDCMEKRDFHTCFRIKGHEGKHRCLHLGGDFEW
jgi:hypothetical protein